MISPPQHPFRFGVQMSSAPDGETWRRQARRAEAIGYSTISAADHLDDQFAPVPALVAAADATSEIRVGLMVLCHDYRHPVVAAKEIATLDVLCDGRLDVGIGAGWQTSDYQHAGIPMDAAGLRIERTAEYLDVLEALWADGPATVDGRWYHVRDLDGRPKPVQSPRPPLVLGGGGRRMLSLAAERADVVALNIKMVSGTIDHTAGPSATAEATDRKLAWIAEAAGDRFDDLVIQTRLHLAMVTDDKPGVAAMALRGVRPPFPLPSCWAAPQQGLADWR